jgi:hypothetical protein
VITIRKVADASCTACGSNRGRICEFRLGLDHMAGLLIRLCRDCRSMMESACVTFDLNKAYK